MSQISVPPAGPSPEQAGIGKTPRLFYFDHLRSFLIILVVLHHVAAVYGAGTPFYYVEPPFSDPLAFNLLLAFMLINQAWFMGAFYLLAGYFTPGSFDRKGSGSFLKDRLLRLGIPLILFFFVLNPVSSIGFYLMPASLTGVTTPLTWEALAEFIGLGPLWFVALLLIFSLGYAAWRWLTRRWSSPTSQSSPPSYLQIAVFILALAGVSYLVRIVVPIGKDVRGFPTLAYLPQYLSFFILGIVAYRRNWFRTLPNSMGVAGLVVATIGGVVLFPLTVSGTMFSLEITDPALFVGGGYWQAAVYALWDSSFAVGMCLGLITFFRHFIREQTRFGWFLSRQGYTVYIVHIPIIVFLAHAMRGITLESLLKFGLAALIIVPTCFIVAYIIRKIPFASRIL